MKLSRATLWFVIGLLALCAWGCSRDKSAKDSAKAGKTESAAPNSAQASATKTQNTEAAAAPGQATAVAAELAAYNERRKPKRPVIGGCVEACETPDKAVGLLFDALGQKDAKVRVEALQPLFDWSILQVDGTDKGSRWAEMWGDHKQRGARLQEIDLWLQQWSSWVGRIDETDGLVKARMGGVKIKPLPGRTDVVEVAIRHPRLRDDKTESTWRLEWTRRGYEWLVSRIDHVPSKRLKTPSPQGSAAPGRL